jgi:UDP-glucose 4-epimerase
MRLAITGSKGRLGSALCSELSLRGHEIAAFSRNADAHHFGLEALDDHLKTSAPVEFLIHLAWSVLPSTAEEDPGAAWREDIPLLGRILSSLESLPKARRPIFVFFSSCSVYGEAGPDNVMSEEGQAHPKGWYASGKLAAEQLIRLYERRRGVSALVLRVTNPYGFSQIMSSPQGIIPALLRAAKERIDFPLWGSREASKDYLHINDVCNALVLLMQHRRTGVYNVASGAPVSTANLIQCVEEALGTKIRVRDQPKREWDVMSGHYSNRALTNATGWLPQVSLREGIRRLIKDDLKTDR